MTTFERNASLFSLSLGVALGISVLFAAIFVGYVLAEKQIDRENDIRAQSILLAAELRGSSDDLSRMARTYVVTGDPIYKQHYQEILDIRDGRKPRPVDYQNVYWDLVPAEDQRPNTERPQAPAPSCRRPDSLDDCAGCRRTAPDTRFQRGSM
mgnify:CR=1 FL=1